MRGNYEEFSHPTSQISHLIHAYFQKSVYGFLTSLICSKYLVRIRIEFSTL